MKKICSFVFLSIFISIAHADIFSDEKPDSNIPVQLSTSAYPGTYWYKVKDGRSARMVINKDLTAKIYGYDHNQPVTWNLNKGKVLGNLLRYQFHRPKGNLYVELLVSGHQKGKQKVLFGTSFTFHNGVIISSNTFTFKIP